MTRKMALTVPINCEAMVDGEKRALGCVIDAEIAVADVDEAPVVVEWRTNDYGLARYRAFEGRLFEGTPRQGLIGETDARLLFPFNAKDWRGVHRDHPDAFSLLRYPVPARKSLWMKDFPEFVEDPAAHPEIIEEIEAVREELKTYVVVDDQIWRRSNGPLLRLDRHPQYINNGVCMRVGSIHSQKTTLPYDYRDRLSAFDLLEHERAWREVCGHVIVQMDEPVVLSDEGWSMEAVREDRDRDVVRCLLASMDRFSDRIFKGDMGDDAVEILVDIRTSAEPHSIDDMLAVAESYVERMTSVVAERKPHDRFEVKAWGAVVAGVKSRRMTFDAELACFAL